MAWIRLELGATHEAVDWISTLLATSNYTETIDITANLAADRSNDSWPFIVHLYVPNDGHGNARIDELFGLLSPLHRTGLTTDLQVAVIEEKPTHSERASVPHQRIGQRFVVLAPNASYQPAKDDILLRLNQTLAFGSGFHPATMLSLRLLEQYVQPTMNTLDLGSGSGILSIAMAKLGAQVLALDNDRVAVEATQDAVLQNGLESQITVMEGSLGCGSQMGHWMGGTVNQDMPMLNPNGSFDLIAANVLARVHINLAADFRQALHPAQSSSLLITAGFTNDYEDEIDRALQEEGFEAIGCERNKEWVALVHRLCA